MQPRVPTLETAANDLASEIWEKKWQHLAELKSRPVQDCREITDELARRFPGCTLQEYKGAITKAVFECR